MELGPKMRLLARTIVENRGSTPIYDAVWDAVWTLRNAELGELIVDTPALLNEDIKNPSELCSSVLAGNDAINGLTVMSSVIYSVLCRYIEDMY